MGEKNMIDQPVVILVRPQLGENIGMCARAMLNCGLTELRLVAPRDGWPNESAVSSASGATKVLENVRVYDSVAAATADLHWTAATTARGRDLAKPVFTPESAAQHAFEAIHTGHERVGILFGPERTGLENDDLAACQALVSIPLNPDFSSLNLAQAVLILSYEWRKMAHKESIMSHKSERTGESEWATTEELTYFLNKLDENLVKYHFYRTEEMKPSVWQNIRNMFARNRWTSQEIQTLHGIIGTLTGSRLKS